MGARHVGYGTKDEHYPLVLDTMVNAMSKTAGDAWSDQYTKDWSDALTLVASIMIDGAHNAQQKKAA